MNQLVFKQFELTRGNFLKAMESVTEKIANVQPEGFNNNILWNVGHVLTVTEQFMFGFPKKTTYLPENYLALFGNGTKPADWQGDVPALTTLVEQLKEQLPRLQAIPADSMDQELKQPFRTLQTFGELANMASFHEALHLGQILSMKRLVELTAVKN